MFFNWKPRFARMNLKPATCCEEILYLIRNCVSVSRSLALSEFGTLRITTDTLSRLCQYCMDTVNTS